MINLNSIPGLLRPGLDAIIDKYTTFPAQWKDIFTTRKSDKAQEYTLEMRSPGYAAIKPEGQPTPNDANVGQRISTIIQHKTIALQYSITKEAVRDNLYKEQFKMGASQLMNGLTGTKNVLAANILNQAFNTAYPIGDGQPVCSQNHPIDGGLLSNTLAGQATVDFSELAIEQSIIAIQKFQMQSGILCNVKAKQLIIPRELQFAASRLLNSTYRVDTANNEINALYHGDYFPGGYTVNQYLTSTTAFFIKTDADFGLTHYQRDPIEAKTWIDETTSNVLYKAEERYSFCVLDPRGIFGSPGV
jgi:hypothetical protein